MRHRSLLMFFAVLMLLTFGAAPARADWLGLPGLQPAGWVREYASSPPTTMYAATEGNGVWRSTTGGATWSQFSEGLKTIPGAMSVRTVFTSGLSTVYAGTTAGLFKSEGGGAFQPVAQGPEEDPKNPKKLNAAVQTVFTGLVPGQMLAGVASGGVYKSTDGGATWRRPAPGNGMAASQSVWSLGSYKDGVIYAATDSGIYVSLDFGSTWTLSNDGISGITLRTFADDKWPNIYYASGTDGVFRSLNAGLTWSRIGDDGGQTRALVQFSGINEKRLYVGTEQGVYAGRTGTGALPGPVYWRHVTTAGLGTNTIFWALSNFITTPGTLVAGTQSNGGYFLTFEPAQPLTNPVLSSLAPKKGETLVTTNGTWKGTPTIEFEYQWQDCTTTCEDIEDATTNTFVVPEQGRKYRVAVTGSNDFPMPGPLARAFSATTAASAAQPGTLPGDTQRTKASIEVLNDPDGFPQPGETLHAHSWLFNPAASQGTTFQWFRCAGAVCTPIAGATGQNHLLADEDVTRRLCVEVTGKNASGSATLDCSGQTNEIFPKAPKAVKPTTMTGTAYVGETLVGGVGQWEWAGTRFERQWESCAPNGTSCQTITGAKAATYVVKAAELGRKLRVRIAVDSNQANKKPDPIEVFTPLSDVVTLPPAAPADPQPLPQNPGSPPPSPPAGDTSAPALGGVSVAKGAQLKLTLSEPAKLTVVVQRARNGRLKGSKCKVGAKQGKKCTVLSTVSTTNMSAAAGARTVALAKKKLKRGDYRAVITAVDAAGNRTSRTVSFKVK